MREELKKAALKPSSLEECHVVIEGLWSFCRTLEQQLQNELSELKKEVNLLRKENADLKEKLNINSNNSSKPPSQDINKKKNKKPKSNRRKGGQPGHTGTSRKMAPLERVNHIIECKPKPNCPCGGMIITSTKYRRHQVYEIPKIQPEITEYQLYYGTCACCHKKQTAHLPLGVNNTSLGPNGLSLIGLLTSKYRLSKRLVVSLFKDLYDFNLSVGTVSNSESIISDSLLPSFNKARVDLKEQPVIHADETGYKESHKNGWAWIGSTSALTVFLLRPSRGKKVAKELLGDTYNGIVISDRYPGYNWIFPKRRQVCWAHLLRDIRRISERSGSPGRIGDQLLFYYQKIFCYWKKFDCGKIRDRDLLQKVLAPSSYGFELALESGACCGHKRTESSCKNILKLRDALWTFISTENVSPTNNHAERQLRPLVISRKLSYGTQSDRGSRFIERIFTAVISCQQQGRDILDFLQKSIHSHFSNKTGPLLIVN